MLYKLSSTYTYTQIQSLSELCTVMTLINLDQVCFYKETLQYIQYILNIEKSAAQTRCPATIFVCGSALKVSYYVHVQILSFHPALRSPIRSPLKVAVSLLFVAVIAKKHKTNNNNQHLSVLIMGVRRQVNNWPVGVVTNLPSCEITKG